MTLKRWKWVVLPLLFLGSLSLSLTLSGDRQGGASQMSKGNVTRLMRAAEKGDAAEVSRLIESEGNVDATDGEGRTALFYAARNGQEDGSAVKALIAAGANVNAVSEDKLTPLFAVVDPGGTQANLRALLEAGADPNYRAPGGEFALRIATSWNNVQGVRLLLEKGADVNLSRDDGRTALMEAAEAGHVEIASALVERGADVRATDKQGRTASDLAQTTRHPNEYVRQRCQQVLLMLSQQR